MAGISRFEKGVLLLTAGFVLFTGGWFLAGQNTSEPEVIDLNAADAYDLDRLPGIGPAKAEAILAYREEHGPFQSVDDLLSVSGIGEVTLENLRPYVTAGGAAETAEAAGG